MQVKNDMVVSFRYIMKNGRGELLENSWEGSPTTYLHGTSEILPLLQKQLEGLVRGDRKSLFLLKSSGLTDDDYAFEVIIDEVRKALPEELILGYPVQLVIEKCEVDCECYGVGVDNRKESYGFI